MTRMPIPASTSRASKPLVLVHTDVMGPFNTPSFGGSVYAIVFTDDYSRYLTVMPMNSKDDALSRLIQYKTMMENITGHTLKKIRSDFEGNTLVMSSVTVIWLETE